MDQNQKLELMFKKMQEFLMLKTPCIRSSFDTAKEHAKALEYGREDIEIFVAQMLPGISVNEPIESMRASAFISALIQSRVSPMEIVRLNLRNAEKPLDYVGAMLAGVNVDVYGNVGNHTFFNAESCRGRVFGTAKDYFGDLALGSNFWVREVGKGGLLESRISSLMCMKAGDFLGKMAKNSSAVVVERVGKYAGLCSKGFTLNTVAGAIVGPNAGYNAESFLHHQI